MSRRNDPADEPHTESSPRPSTDERRRNEGSAAPPDPAKQEAYPLRDTVGWPTGRGPDHRRPAEEKERGGERPGERPSGSGTADQRPTQDRSGAVAPPQEGEQPGSSGELGGTPGAPAAGPGRQTD